MTRPLSYAHHRVPQVIAPRGWVRIRVESPEHEKVSLVPIRRDNASRIARPCRICGAETEEP